MKKKVANVLKNSGMPALVVAKADETKNVVFRAYTVLANDEEATILLGGGASDMHSPINGERIEPKQGVNESSSTFEEVSETFPVIAHCTKCNHDTCAPKELAVEMDGVKFHCINCGDELAAEYFADFEGAEDDSEDTSEDDSMDTSEDDSEDMSDDSEDTSEDDSEDMSDDSEDMSDEEDAGDNEDITDSMESDDFEDTSEDDSEGSEDESTEDMSDDSEDMSDEEDASKTVANIQIVMARTMEFANDVRVIPASSKRYEVFIGDRHLGHLNMDVASQAVVNLASNQQAFNRSVIMSLAKDFAEIQKTGKVTSDMSNFGLQLAEIEVPISEAVDQMVSEQTEAVKEQISQNAETESAALLKAMDIAMEGINKGILKGPNLVNEFAKVLATYGVRNASEEAANVVKRVSTPFLNAAYEQARNIVKEGEAYARGLSQTIASAQYSQPEIKEDPSLLTAAVYSRKPAPVNSNPSQEAASVATDDRISRFRNVFKRC